MLQKRRVQDYSVWVFWDCKRTLYEKKFAQNLKKLIKIIDNMLENLQLQDLYKIRIEMNDCFRDIIANRKGKGPPINKDYLEKKYKTFSKITPSIFNILIKDSFYEKHYKNQDSRILQLNKMFDFTIMWKKNEITKEEMIVRIQKMFVDDLLKGAPNLGK